MRAARALAARPGAPGPWTRWPPQQPLHRALAPRPPRAAAPGGAPAADGAPSPGGASGGSMPGPPGAWARYPFTPSWPAHYKRRLEAATLERAHEADVTPTVFDFALWRRHRSRTRYVEHLVTLAQ
jgi:hypothetical protein